jgi:hypothetical protein
MERVDEEGQLATAETLAKIISSCIPQTHHGPATLRIFDIHGTIMVALVTLLSHFVFFLVSAPGSLLFQRPSLHANDECHSASL